MITLNFDGIDGYIEIADDARFSVATTGGLTVAAWMRPDVLAFPNFESTGYVHWIGKGEINQQEWTFRMYNKTTTDTQENRRKGRLVGACNRAKAKAAAARDAETFVRLSRRETNCLTLIPDKAA